MSEEVPKVEFTVRVPKMRCPICGYTSPPGDAILIHNGPYKGEYCSDCYTRWIATHVPKLILVKGGS